MFAIATGKQKTYEVGIYNKEVRHCVKENDSHTEFADEWADVHYQNIVANNKAEALVLVSDKYPAEKGFVVASLVQSTHTRF